MDFGYLLDSISSGSMDTTRSDGLTMIIKVMLRQLRIGRQSGKDDF